MIKNNRSGFTLIEVLVATFILLVGLLGMNSMLITSIKFNEANQMRISGQKLLKGSVSKLRSINISEFNKSNLQSKFSFSVNIPSNYPTGGAINASCPTDYDYRLYKGYSIEKNVNGVNLYYKYTVKLCVDDNYLPPYLKRAIITIYWRYGKQLHQIGSEIFITPGE